MQKLLALFLASVVFLSSCQSLWEWPGSEEGSTETTETTTTTDDDYYSYTAPTDAMSSLNRYIDLTNDVNSQMSYLESDLYYLEGYIADYATYGYDPSFTCYFELYDYDALEYDTANPVGLTSSEAASLKGQSEEIFAIVDEVESLCTQLGKHVTSQDYVDDNFETAYSLMDQLYAQMDAYYEIHESMGDEIDDLYDIYDTWVLDPSDPIDVGIDNMDKDLEMAEAIFDYVEAVYDSGVLTGKSTDLEALYDELAASVEGHISNPPDFGGDYIKDYYDSYYEQMDEYYLPTVKRILRTLETNDADQLYSDYGDLLDNYNYLVDYYNYYLDVSAY